MLKRDLAILGAQTEVDSPRAKRRRDTGAAPSTSVTETPVAAGKSAQASAASEQPAQVQEQGLLLWEIAKNAVNKEQRVLSDMFLSLPSKRQYADYYLIIKKPVSLNQIKEGLDRGQYPTLQAAKNDLEQCFVNAKRYNQRDSQIWKDAKLLHKLVKKEYSRMTGQVDDDGDGSDEEGKKKDKQLNFTRLCKTRLQKLVEKTDDNGRVLATEFMELPSKKLWPQYYVQIARPMCFEDIFKRIKSKEYENTAEFAKDVELIFDNAMAFNADHTPIWEDAQQLRVSFAKLMSDMPEPFALPQYPATSAGKIKLKRPVVQASSSTEIPAPAASLAAPSPAPALAPVAEPALPRAPATAAPALVTKRSAPLPAAPPALPAAQRLPYMPAQAAPPPPKPAPKAAPMPAAVPTLALAPSPHYARPPVYAPRTHHPVALAPAAAAPFPIVQAVARSPATVSPAPAPVLAPAPVPAPAPPPPPLAHPLQSATVFLQPSARVVALDHGAGVRSWFVRLAPGEDGLRLGDVAFLQEDEESGDEAVDDAMNVEEDGAADGSRAKGKGKARKGKRGKGAKDKALRENGIKASRRKPPPELLVKLNGAVLPNPSDAAEAEWDLKPVLGALNVVEVGSKGGVVWKVYVQ